MDIRGSPTVAWRLYCIADMCVLQTHGLRGTGREAFYGEGTRDCRREGGGKGERVRRIAEWKKTLTGGLFVWKWKWAPWKWRPEVWDEPSEGQGVDDLTMKNCGFICINWKCWLLLPTRFVSPTPLESRGICVSSQSWKLPVCGGKNVRIADFYREHLAYCTALMSAS